jgi:hypothetical protein
MALNFFWLTRRDMEERLKGYCIGIRFTEIFWKEYIHADLPKFK